MGWRWLLSAALVVLWMGCLAACGGGSGSSSATGATAPSITSQPQSQTVALGATATFSVTATGTAPLSYQWSKNGTTISGATNSSYTTPATTSGDDGATFTVEVSNTAGSQTSNPAMLTVTAAAVAPTITTQPQNETVTVGAMATFTVVATGTTPLSYQWYEGGTAITGATSASYTTPATVSGNNGETFKVTVSNSAGSKTSNTATLTVNAAAGPGAPIMFQHISTSTNPVGYGETGRAFKISTESLPANTVAVLGVTAPHGTTITISDTLTGADWPAAACSADSGAGNYVSEVFVRALGASGGVDTITVGVGSTGIQPVQFDITFWQNVSTTAPVGGSLCAGNLTPNASALISPGSFTPTNNNSNGGNVIWNYTALCGAAGGNPTSWTAASGFTLLNAEIIWITKQGFPQASQYELQTSAGSVSPSITSTGDTTDCFNSATVALAAANNSAVAPSTIHVQGIGHESLSTFSSPGVLKIQVPWKGNLRVITFTWTADSPDAGPEYVSSITSSDGCNFTEGPGMHGVGGATIWYAQNCSACPTCTASLNWTGGANTAQFSFRYVDVENALASSYQNNAAVGFTSCGTTVADQPTITPSGATHGLVIQAMGNGNGPVTGLTSPTGAVFDLWLFTGQTDGDLADNGDEVGHYYYSSTGAQNWGFTKANGGDECWSGAIAFN